MAFSAFLARFVYETNGPNNERGESKRPKHNSLQRNKDKQVDILILI